MKEHTRYEVINKLTEYSLDTIDWGVIDDILKYGCKGYIDFTNEELIEEWEFFFEEDIKIKD